MEREEAIEILKIKRECYDQEGMSCEMNYDKYKTDRHKTGCEICDEAIDMAIEALSAPPTDIVYCKDCKRCESDGGALMTCEVTEMIVDDDYYCWWGERREP